MPLNEVKAHCKIVNIKIILGVEKGKFLLVQNTILYRLFNADFKPVRQNCVSHFLSENPVQDIFFCRNKNNFVHVLSRLELLDHSFRLGSR